MRSVTAIGSPCLDHTAKVLCGNEDNRYFNWAIEFFAMHALTEKVTSCLTFALFNTAVIASIMLRVYMGSGTVGSRNVVHPTVNLQYGRRFTISRNGAACSGADIGFVGPGNMSAYNITGNLICKANKTNYHLLEIS